MSSQRVVPFHASEIEMTQSERSLRVYGPLVNECGDELESAVRVIAEGWVADDIVIDLRDTPRIDEHSLASVASAGVQAAGLGHRLVVRAARPLREALDKLSYTGSFVVID